jgi:hypothetical protein
MAHETAHVAQQTGGAGLNSQGKFSEKSDKDTIHRSPYPTSTKSLHEDMSNKYRKETGDISGGAAQYSPGYQNWLSTTTPKTQWLPPIEQAVNPLDRLAAGQSTGKTTMRTDKGDIRDGNDIATRMQNLSAAIKPTSYKTSPGLVSGQVTCKFDPAFQLMIGTRIIIATSPNSRGWKSTMDPALFGSPAECAAKKLVKTRLEGTPGHKDFHQLVRDSELEHVTELKALYDRHIVPFYHFAMNLQATAGSEDECKKQLEARLATRLEQTTMGFVLGDLAASQRYDDPLSTHHGDYNAVVDDASCSGITITASQRNPQQDDREPGNVEIIAPTIEAIDPDNLRILGSRLVSAGKVVRTFSSPAVANEAMAIFMILGVTEMQTIGPFTMLFNNGKVPSSPVQGRSNTVINASLAQVTKNVAAGIPIDQQDWVISQVNGDKFQLIINFGADRDQAYSAIKHVRSNQFGNHCWIGSDSAPELNYFTQ